MQKLPSVKEQEIKFLHHDPQNIVINGVSLGEDEFKAGSIGIGIVDAKVKQQLLIQNMYH